VKKDDRRDRDREKTGRQGERKGEENRGRYKRFREDNGRRQRETGSRALIRGKRGGDEKETQEKKWGYPIVLEK